MIQAAKPHADDKNHRQVELLRQIGNKLAFIYRHAPAAGAFNKSQIRAQAQHTLAEAGEAIDAHLAVAERCSNMWRCCFRQTHRVDLVIGQLQ